MAARLKERALLLLGLVAGHGPLACSSNVELPPDTDITAPPGCPGVTVLEIERNPAEYSEELKRGLAIVGLSEEVRPVGSFEVAFMKYPSDVDLTEFPVFNGSAEAAKRYYSGLLQDMARKASLSERFFWGDFKAGFDPRFMLDIGQASRADGVSAYNAPAIRAAIHALKAEGLLSDEQEETLLARVVDNPTFDEWSVLHEALRQLYTLRWTLQEVSAGQKALVGGTVLPLSEAIEETLVKVDLLGPVTPTGGYTELTNVYYLQYRRDGETHVLTVALNDYENVLRKEVTTLSDPLKRKSLKAAKRLFILARLLEDYPVMLKLGPLLQSDAAALSQVVGESEAVRTVLEKYGLHLSCPNVALALGLQTQGFQQRVINHSRVFSPQQLEAQVFGPIYRAVTANCPNNEGNLEAATVTEWIERLLELEGMLKPIVESEAAAYLAARGIDLDAPLSTLTGTRGQCPDYTAVSDLVPYSCLKRQFGYCKVGSWKCLCSESWADPNYFEACMHVSAFFEASNPQEISATDLIAEGDAHCATGINFRTFDSCIWGARQVLNHCSLVQGEYLPTPGAGG